MPGGTGSLLAWAVRLTVGRGASHAVVEYEAVNDETNEVGVRGIGYAFRAAIGAVDKGLIWTAEGEFPLPDEGRELLYEEPVARPSPNWICWRGPRGGLAIAIKEMGRKAPKALRVRPSGYSIGFLPERAMDGAVGGAVTLQPGEAIRDTALFYFVGPTTQRQQVADDIQSICPS
ncbi:MAG: hypothetical protein CO095_17125 [Armatimonadetes bacterium CG_4_9_14_3_um_filter_58_7]|nr:MAG: hypothetical protein CO095_17125 [Armatimonadetes bacterium CG_4_9_14_3_um_filter_58_7]